ncbi:MAG TPA: protein kinase, partial [Vicinamibacterales bacterium]|nr:protein kinase [Vicinamibacterales bacterium]
SASPVSATMSPTLSMHATQAGFILGTAAYMAPEQVRGAPVDKRADVWAFGVVLYEMLTGRRLFAGDTISDTLASVLREPIALDTLPASTPASLRRLLQRCLERDPKRRLRDIGDARLELEPPAIDDAARVPAGPRPVRMRRLAVALAVTSLVAVASGAALIGVAARRPYVQPSLPYRFVIPVSRDLPLQGAGGGGMAISPDGRWLVYASPRGIARRAFDQLDAELVRGVDAEARAPFFSPDSQWIGYEIGTAAGIQLKKVPVNGGIAVTIGELPAPARGTWGDDGTIVFTARGRRYRIPSAGGRPEAVALKPDGSFLADPVFLPGSAVVLAGGGPPDSPSGQIYAIRVATGEVVVVTEGTSPRVVAPDRDVFEQRGALWTARFDVNRLAFREPPVPLVENVRANGRFAMAAASPATLAFVAGAVAESTSVVWLDRKGQTSPAIADAAAFQQPRLSPDGGRIAVSVQSASGADIWVYDLERGTHLRLTTEGVNRRPIWSPDGKRIAFQAVATPGRTHIVTTSADGGGGQTPLIDRSATTQFPDSWSTDGRLLLFNEGLASRDIWVHAMEGGDQPDRPLVATPFSERSAMISPDGRWFAFVSNESGRDEIYVQPIAGGAKIAVSSGGGHQPLWARNGRELFYRADDWLVASDMSVPARPGTPVRLFEFPRAVFGEDPNVVEYDVAADGRFLAVRRTGRADDEIHVITDWLR